jgi:hypothetical protein
MAPTVSPAEQAAIGKALAGRAPVCMGVVKLYRAEPGGLGGWQDVRLEGVLAYAIDKANAQLQTLSLFAAGPPAKLLLRPNLRTLL